MPVFDFEGAESRLAAFAASVKARASDHNVATMGLDFEATVASANALFVDVSDVDTRWHYEVAGGSLPYTEAGLERVTALYRDWGEMADAVLALLDQGFEGMRESAELVLLRENRNEVRGILTPDDEFFNDPALFARQQEALDAFHRGETVEFEEMGD